MSCRFAKVFRIACLAVSGIVIAVFVVTGCGTQRKARDIADRKVSAGLQLPDEKRDLRGFESSTALTAQKRDTIVVTDDETGAQMILMNAVEDETGEMVAHDVLQPATVVARFRNVAERGGKVDLEFQIIVPRELQDSRWQLRFNPDMFILGDSLRLDPVIITGRDYRKAQLRGYQQYEKWLATIITDSTKFIREKQLEYFLQRNIPSLLAYKNDTTYVSDEQFASVFGVTEREALDHYTKKMAKRRNDRRSSRRESMFRRYVKSPIVSEGIRLDTIIVSPSGDFIYNYVQTVNTRPKLRKVDIVLSGEIFEQDRKVYTVPRTDPLTFYISSLSTLLDDKERYLTRVVERRAAVNTACWIEFEQGRDEVCESLGNNSEEIGRIKANVASLIRNEAFDLDSIVVTASASPEGSYALNSLLAARRSESVSRFFDQYIRHYADSLDREEGIMIDYETNSESLEKVAKRVSFVSRCNPENWDMLDVLVEQDTVLTRSEKDRYRELSVRVPDVDERERLMAAEPSYRRIRETLYPRLRTVRFDFHLHRKGMIKDTIHTTVVDSVYMAGVQALRDHDYELAVTLLRPYGDYNAAVAFCALDYNASAFEILSKLEKTAEVNYMLALVYSRRGDEQNAVQCYMRSCRQNPAMIHRGSLDPEISTLIRKYDLNRQDDDDFGDF